MVLQVLKWCNKFYFECILPFRLHSSSAIFNSIADAVEWILKHEFSIQTLLHYLDDYLNVANRSCSSVQCQLDIISEVIRYLEFPIAEKKFEGPIQILIFLGIEQDTLLLEAHLQDKLAELKQCLNLLQSGHTSVGSLDKFPSPPMLWCLDALLHVCGT